MGKLIYSVITSLDGYIEDKEGRFDWAEPDEEVHTFVNHLERSVGTYLFGRRMYETMVYWETAHTLGELRPYEHDFASIWLWADKIVYSTTLDTVSSARTRIERHFEPEAIRRLKTTLDSDISIGGPGLAAHAIRAGLIDEFQLFVIPMVVGGGKKALPDDVFVKVELLNQHRFANGTIYLQYGIGRA